MIASGVPKMVSEAVPGGSCQCIGELIFSYYTPLFSLFSKDLKCFVKLYTVFCLDVVESEKIVSRYSFRVLLC